MRGADSARPPRVPSPRVRMEGVTRHDIDAGISDFAELHTYNTSVIGGDAIFPRLRVFASCRWFLYATAHLSMAREGAQERRGAALFQFQSKRRRRKCLARCFCAAVDYVKIYRLPIFPYLAADYRVVSFRNTVAANVTPRENKHVSGSHVRHTTKQRFNGQYHESMAKAAQISFIDSIFDLVRAYFSPC